MIFRAYFLPLLDVKTWFELLLLISKGSQCDLGIEIIVPLLLLMMIILTMFAPLLEHNFLLSSNIVCLSKFHHLLVIFIVLIFPKGFKNHLFR